jgi:putative NADH-flavin reductase
VLGRASGVVLAVTPFTAPPPAFAGFDRDYYATIISGLDRARAARLVFVGLTATAELDDGSRFLDHADLFPPFLAPFAEAHLRATAALRETTLDWAALVPPAGLGASPPAGGPTAPGYRLCREPVTLADATSALDHATFAAAVADELASPAVHQARMLVRRDAVPSGTGRRATGHPGR